MAFLSRWTHLIGSWRVWVAGPAHCLDGRSQQSHPGSIPVKEMFDSSNLPFVATILSIISRQRTQENKQSTVPSPAKTKCASATAKFCMCRWKMRFLDLKTTVSTIFTPQSSMRSSTISSRRRKFHSRPKLFAEVLTPCSNSTMKKFTSWTYPTNDIFRLPSETCR